MLYSTALHLPWSLRDRWHPKPRALICGAERGWPQTEKDPQTGGPSHLCRGPALSPSSPAHRGGRPASRTPMTLLALLWVPSLWRPHLTGRARKLWVFKVLPTLPFILVKIHCLYLYVHKGKKGFPGGSVIKNPPANTGDAGLTPGSERSPGEGSRDLLHYSCLRNPMDRGAWRVSMR